MLDQITKILEKYNVPTNLVSEVTDIFKDGFQMDDVKKVYELIKNNDEIQNSDEIINDIKSNLSPDGAIDDLKSGDVGGALDKAKGMLGM